jgi:beta-N-acetylhexosaminidase
MPGNHILLAGRRTIAALCLLFIFACGQPQDRNNFFARISSDQTIATIPVPASFTVDSFYSASPVLDSLVDTLFNALSFKERASQLIMDASSEAVNADLPFYRIKQLVADTIAGGVIFLKGSKEKFGRQLLVLDSASRNQSKMFYACDCEPALFNQKMTGTPAVAVTRDLKDQVQVKQAALRISAVLQEIGIGINFAPVSDIGLNKKVINNRSFGINPEDIVTKSVAFVKTTQSGGIAACLKHFPGHGAIEGDTHKGQVVISGELSELSTFTSIIAQSHPVFVMVGHMGVKNNAAYNTQGLPCSVSPQIVTKLLKETSGFTGIVITDAMNMKALDNITDVDWKAIQAGVDIVLMPRNARRLNARLVEALKSDRPVRGRLETSVKKVLRLKICMEGSRKKL